MQLFLSIDVLKVILPVFAIIAGVFVITTKNAIISVFNLIVLYILVAFYLIYLGITYLGISYIVVYIGAIAILFLFVIMMIDIEVVEKRSNNYLTLLFLLLGGFFFTLKDILRNIGLVKMKSILFNEEKNNVIDDNLLNLDTDDILNFHLGFTDYALFNEKYLNEINTYNTNWNEYLEDKYLSDLNSTKTEFEYLFYDKSIEFLKKMIQGDEESLNMVLSDMLYMYDSLKQEKIIQELLRERDNLLKRKEELVTYLSPLEVVSTGKLGMKDDEILNNINKNISDNNKWSVINSETRTIFNSDIWLNKLNGLKYDEELLNNNYLMIVPNWDSAVNRITQISAIGDVLYTVYHIFIYIISVILLIGMVGAILLTEDSSQEIRIIRKFQPIEDNKKNGFDLPWLLIKWIYKIFFYKIYIVIIKYKSSILVKVIIFKNSCKEKIQLNLNLLITKCKDIKSFIIYWYYSILLDFIVLDLMILTGEIWIWIIKKILIRIRILRQIKLVKYSGAGGGTVRTFLNPDPEHPGKYICGSCQFTRELNKAYSNTEITRALDEIRNAYAQTEIERANWMKDNFIMPKYAELQKEGRACVSLDNIAVYDNKLFQTCKKLHLPNHPVKAGVIPHRKYGVKELDELNRLFGEDSALYQATYQCNVSVKQLVNIKDNPLSARELKGLEDLRMRKWWKAKLEGKLSQAEVDYVENYTPSNQWDISIYVKNNGKAQGFHFDNLPSTSGNSKPKTQNRDNYLQIEDNYDIIPNDFTYIPGDFADITTIFNNPQIRFRIIYIIGSILIFFGMIIYIERATQSSYEKNYRKKNISWRKKSKIVNKKPWTWLLLLIQPTWVLDLLYTWMLNNICILLGFQIIFMFYVNYRIVQNCSYLPRKWYKYKKKAKKYRVYFYSCQRDLINKKVVVNNNNNKSKYSNEKEQGKKGNLIPPFFEVLNIDNIHSESILGNLFYFIIVITIIAALLLFINSYFSLSVKYLDKGGGFECGFTSFVQTRERFNVIFYRVSLLFLVFDLEIILIFPYTAIYQKYQNISKNNVLAFLYILIVGFIYELKEGALNIVKKAHSTELSIQD